MKHRKPSKKEREARWEIAYALLKKIEINGNKASDLTWKEIITETKFNSSTLQKNKDFKPAYLRVKEILVRREAMLNGEVLTDEDIQWRMNTDASRRAQSKERWDIAFKHIEKCEVEGCNPNDLLLTEIVKISGLSMTQIAHNKNLKLLRNRALEIVQSRFNDAQIIATKNARINQSYAENIPYEESLDDIPPDIPIRKIRYINLKDAYAATPMDIQNVVLKYTTKASGEQYIDIGRFAYRDRIQGNGSTFKGAFRVNLDSLDKSRLSFLRNWVGLLNGRQSVASAKNLVGIFSTFIKWIESNNIEVDLSDYDSTISTLNSFLKYLKGRTIKAVKGAQYTENNSPITNEYALIAKEALIKSVASGLSVRKDKVIRDCKVKFKTSLKDKVGRSKKKAKTKYSVKSNAKALENYINVVHQYITGKAELPLLFEYDGVKRYSHGIEFVSYPDHVKDLALISLSFLNNDDLKECSNKVKATYFKSTRDNAEHKNRLANLAMVAGCQLFMLNSAFNLSVILNLEIDTLKYESTLQGYRAIGLKARSGKGGTWVKPEVGVRFLPVMKKILDIRKFLLDGEQSEWLWYKKPSGGRAKKPYKVKENDFSIKARGDKRQGGMRGLFSRIYPNAEWVTARPARNTISGIVNDLADGDITESSAILGHSKAVAAKNYLFKALDDVADEFGDFLNNLRADAISLSRSASVIPVKILDVDEKSHLDSPSGHCDDPLNPEVIDELKNSGVKPNCKTFENCFFCKHFAVHIDEVDLRKLFSIAYLCHQVKSVTSGNIEEYSSYWGIILDRINEIIGHMVLKEPEIEPVVERIREEVFEMEKLDSFWENHLDFLISTGEAI